MAKMFYSREEVQQKLGLTSEQIDKLVADGRLREFRDGAKIMFKAAEVEALEQPDISSGDTGGTEIGLVPSDTADQISLSPTDTGSQIGLSPTDTGSEVGLVPGDSADQISLSPTDTGSQIGLVPGDSADQISLSPTDTGSQIGFGAMDSADQISLDDTGEAKADKDDTVITTHGVNVLGDSGDQPADVDDLGMTQIAPDMEDQIQLDSDRSGSGLLDLTREADDTSLGAELLEEIYPGADENAIATQLPSQLEMPSHTGSAGEMEIPAAPVEYARAAEVVDPISGAFGAMMVVPLLVLIYLGCVSSAAITGVRPALFEPITDYVWYVIGGAGLISVIVLLAGHFVLGASDRPARPKAKAKPKAKRPKKAKS